MQNLSGKELRWIESPDHCDYCAEDHLPNGFGERFGLSAVDYRGEEVCSSEVLRQLVSKRRNENQKRNELNETQILNEAFLSIFKYGFAKHTQSLSIFQYLSALLVGSLVIQLYLLITIRVSLFWAVPTCGLPKDAHTIHLLLQASTAEAQWVSLTYFFMPV